MRGLLLRLLVSLLGLLPLGAARALGRILGRLAHLAARRQKALAEQHLRLAFPGADQSFLVETCRSCFIGLGEHLLELCAVRRADHLMEDIVKVGEGDLAPLDDALAEGKGCIVLAGHIGSWELAARAMARRGYDAAAVGRHFRDRGIGDLVEGFRASGGVETLARGAPGTVRRLLGQLRGGGLIFMLVDQDTKVPSVFAPFFGIPAKTPRGPADLALRTNVALVMGFIHRDPSDGAHRMRTERLSLPPRTGDREADVLALTARINERLEEEIRAHPADWVWFHRRWRSRPEDARRDEEAGMDGSRSRPGEATSRGFEAE